MAYFTTETGAQQVSNRPHVAAVPYLPQ